jgi:signal transduction histidine kinase
VQDFADAFKSNCLKLLRSFQDIHLDAQECIATSCILSAPTAIHVNKILMEAVQNTLKHAQAKNIFVVIRCDEQLLIEIKDDGEGFETERSPGNGLHNMEWRAAQAGFRFHLFSEKGKGTRIELVKNIGSEKI